MRQPSPETVPTGAVAERQDPMTCPCAEPRPEIGKTRCRKDGRETFVECQASHWGEPPRCAWDEPDNSPDAVARRLAYGEGGGGAWDR